MRLVCQLFRRRNRQLSPQECYVGQTAYTRRMVGYDNHQRKTMYGRSMLTVFSHIRRLHAAASPYLGVLERNTVASNGTTH